MSNSKKAAHLFAANNNANPAGRPKGSRNKLGEAFLEDMLAAWKRDGEVAIMAVIKSRPHDFLKIIAGILPRDLNVNIRKSEELTDEELLSRMRQLNAIVGPLIEGIDRGAGRGKGRVRVAGQPAGSGQLPTKQETA